jgi:Subtilase family/IPT/TIG domain
MKKWIMFTIIGFLSACNLITQPPVQQSPQITSVKPRVAAAGDPVTILGSGFDSKASVKIGDQIATISSIKSDSIVAIMPTLAPNDYSVTVINPNQKSDSKPGPSVLGASTQTSDYVDGEVFVTLDPTIDEVKLKSLAAQNGFTVLKFIAPLPGSVGACSKGYGVLKDATQGRSTKDAINKVAEQSEVYDADPHTSGRGDTYIDSGPTTNQKPEIDVMSAERAYNFIKSKSISLSSSRVAVLDTGVSTHYEFLDTNSFKVKNLESGRNFTLEDNTADPRELALDVSDMGFSQNAGTGGHGTGVAAIIAAIDDNASGNPSVNVQTPLVGGAAGASILPVKVCTKDNKCLGSDVIAGLCYAINQKVSAMNLSFGGDTPSHSLQRVLETANTQGITVVAAAGNDGDSAPAHYPAAYSSSIPGLIAVGSAAPTRVSANWTGSAFSIPGAWVDLVAPGQTVYTATVSYLSTVTYGYNNLEGTSFAAPWVSATAVMLKGLHPDWTPKQIKDQIVSKAKPLTCSSLIKCGAGLLNMGDTVGAP